MARILLIDDSNLILNMFEKGLTRAGHEIVGKAKDGEQGVKLFNELNPDLILLDITMPNKDGRECLAEMLETKPSAKVVMCSAVMDEKVRQECIQQGARAFIVKSSLSSASDFSTKVIDVINPILNAA